MSIPKRRRPIILTATVHQQARRGDSMRDMNELQKVGFSVLSRLPYPEIFKLGKALIRDYGIASLKEVNPDSALAEELIDRLVELELRHCGKRWAKDSRYVQ
jgi:hypothetical protein